jgi:hypothetical protein
MPSLEYYDDECKNPDILTGSTATPPVLSPDEIADRAARIPAQDPISPYAVIDLLSGVINHLRESVIEGNESYGEAGAFPTYATTRGDIMDSLRNIATALSGGTMPGNPCHITKIPSSVLDIAAGFLTPREQFVMRGVSPFMNVEIRRSTDHELGYYAPGRVLWVASKGQWKVGIILPCGVDESSIIDIVDPRTYTPHVGVHIQIGRDVEYIPTNLLNEHTSSCRNYADLKPPPLPIDHTTMNTPYGDCPHDICIYGYYPPKSNLPHPPTAPSNCYIPDRPINVFYDVKVGTLRPDLVSCDTNHSHMTKALEREAIYGCAFEAGGTYSTYGTYGTLNNRLNSWHEYASIEDLADVLRRLSGPPNNTHFRAPTVAPPRAYNRTQHPRIPLTPPRIHDQAPERYEWEYHSDDYDDEDALQL